MPAVRSTRKSLGPFVTIEGGEGSGKSTLARALVERLRAKSIACLLTREPGGSLPEGLCADLRGLLLDCNRDPMAPMAELLLFLAARAQNLHETITPALELGKWVICDRFSDSTVAYQAFGRQLPRDRVEKLCEIAQGGIRPDLILVLDVDPSVGLKRARGAKGGGDRFDCEDLAFHRRVREGFNTLSRERNLAVLNAQLPPNELCDEAMAHLERRFELRANT